MFWKRKTTIGTLRQIQIPPIPPKKEFSTMLEMLRDAEKYDTENENECRDTILTGLCEYIERFKVKTK